MTSAPPGDLRRSRRGAIEEIRAAAARMPDGHVHYLPGVAHFPFLEAPEETARVVGEFVPVNTPATDAA